MEQAILMFINTMAAFGSLLCVWQIWTLHRLIRTDESAREQVIFAQMYGENVIGNYVWPRLSFIFISSVWLAIMWLTYYH